MLTNNVSMIIIIPKYFFLSNQEANDPLHNYLILVYFYSPLISVSQSMQGLTFSLHDRKTEKQSFRKKIVEKSFDFYLYS